jgi:hypothetical protein
MFESLTNRWSQKKAIRELLKNPLVTTGRDSIAKFWSDLPAVKQQYSKEFIENVARQMMDRVVTVATAHDPLMANRQELGGMTVAAANFQVLVLDPAPADDPTGLRGLLGITGELRRYLPDVAKSDDELQEILHGLPGEPTADDIYSICLTRYRQLHALAHVHHTLRMPLDDFNPNMEKDWFRPFFLCACGASEQHYRLQVGLPATLDPMEALKCSTFMNIVVRGDKYPDLEWERSYGQPVPRIPGPRSRWD